jgi:hypothetical protein
MRCDAADSWHVVHSDESQAARRLSRLHGAQPGDPTMRHLIAILNAKLELCSRLAVFEYEAGSQGQDSCVLAFRRLAEMERESFDDLLACLRDHIDDTTRVRASAAGAQR